MARSSLVKPGKERDFFSAFDTMLDTESAAEERARAQDAITSAMVDFWQTPKEEFYGRLDAFKGRINAFSTAGDWPEILTQTAQVFQGEESYDMGWEPLFKVAPKDPGKDFFEIANIFRGFRFRLIPETGKVKVERMSGDVGIVTVDWYGAAIGWTEQMVRYKKLSIMADMVEQKREARYELLANSHYGLIAKSAAIAGQTTAYSATGATVAEKDAKTINAAYTKAAKRLHGKPGFSGVVNTPVYLLVPIDLLERAYTALATKITANADSGKLVRYPIIPVPTLNTSLWNGATNYGVLVFPKRKIQRVMEEEVKAFKDADPYTLQYVDIIWTAFGAGIGDDQQIEKVMFE